MSTPEPFDPDAYLGSVSSAPAASAFDPDAHLANAVPSEPPAQGLKTEKDSGWNHLVAAAKLIKEHPLTAGIGMTENAFSGTLGALGKMAGRFVDLAEGTPNTHAQQYEQAMYQPHTEAGQQIQKLTGQEASHVGGIVDQIPGVNTPLGQTLKEAVPEALTDIGLLKGGQALIESNAIPRAARAFGGIPGGLADPNVSSAIPHPLQAVADSEAARISNSLKVGRNKGIDLPERSVSPNQVAANGIVQEDLNLPKGPVTPKVLSAAREEFGSPGYQAVEKIPKVQLGSAYEDDIGNIDTSLIKDKYRPPPGGSLTGARAVELSKYLREKASAYFKEGTVEASEKAQAHWDAAQAVEDAVERRLKATGQAEIAHNWDNARTYYAKTYSVESALDGAGNVVVPKLKTQLIKNKPLSGGIQDLATMGAANPEAFKAVPTRPTPGFIRRGAAALAPVAGAGAGAMLGGPFAPLTGAGGAALGQYAGEKLLGK